MKKILMFIVISLMCISFFGCNSIKSNNELKSEQQQVNKIEENKVANLVKDFGSKLQMVSLQAPKDILRKSMQENYGDFVTTALLEKWISNPLDAPGRLTSSPWPDRIEIQTIEKLSDNEYKVNGKIIEITSVEKEKGGVAASRSITLIVRKIDNQWIIDDVTLGSY